MAFQARKTRQISRPAPVGQGTPITPSAAIRSWYAREMEGLFKPMIRDYRETLRNALEHPEVEMIYDAADNVMTAVLKRLDKKWSEIAQGWALKYVPIFIDKMEVYTRSATLSSMTTAGVSQPRQTYTENVARILGSSQQFNHTLVTNLQADVHEKIYSAVMLSLTSPDPNEQGTSGIENALRSVGGMSEERIDLIARDQTSKMNSSLATERLKQGGLDEYEWLHSGGGKQPRVCHEDMDGGIFKLDDDRLWSPGEITFKLARGGTGTATLRKGDLGPPGWAINCRCRMKPRIGLDDDDDDDE